MGIIIDNGDQHLYVQAHGTGGHVGRTIVVQYDEADAWYFELTDLERKALIQALTLKAEMPRAECFIGDHVPGCEHERASEAVQAGYYAHTGRLPDEHFDPPLEGPPADEEPGPDPLDDPHGAREPAFGD